MIFSPPGGWRLWGVIAGVVLAFSFFTWLWLDGKSAGMREERAAWEERVREAEDRTRAAEIALALDVAARREQSQQRTVERVRVVEIARQEIASAENLEGRFAAYRFARDRLRNDAAEHLSRAIGAYNLSLESE